MMPAGGARARRIVRQSKIDKEASARNFARVLRVNTTCARVRAGGGIDSVRILAS